MGKWPKLLIGLLLIANVFNVTPILAQNETGTENTQMEKVLRNNLNVLVKMLREGTSQVQGGIVVRAHENNGWYVNVQITPEEYLTYEKILNTAKGEVSYPAQDIAQWNMGNGVTFILGENKALVQKGALLNPELYGVQDSLTHVREPKQASLIIVNRWVDNKYAKATGSRVKQRFDVGGGIQLAEIPQGTSSGTGFFVTSSGHFLTSNHVIRGRREIGVYYKNVLVPAILVAADEKLDLALLKLDVSAIALPVAGLSGVSLGEQVFTLGFPNMEIQGIQPKYTKGNVSSLTGVKDDNKLMQISVPIQPGNSGGPLFNEGGEVVGVIAATLNNAAARSNVLLQNVNYAVRPDMIRAFLQTANIPLTRTGSKRTPEELTKSIGLIIAR